MRKNIKTNKYRLFSDNNRMIMNTISQDGFLAMIDVCLDRDTYTLYYLENEEGFIEYIEDTPEDCGAFIFTKEGRDIYEKIYKD